MFYCILDSYWVNFSYVYWYEGLVRFVVDC